VKVRIGAHRLFPSQPGKQADPNGEKGIASRFNAPARWAWRSVKKGDGIPFSVLPTAENNGIPKYRRGGGVAAASLQMILLKKAGIVVQGKGRLYTLAPGVLAEGREVRMGICTIKFG
jgi:hypothetical protein